MYIYIYMYVCMYVHKIVFKYRGILNKFSTLKMFGQVLDFHLLVTKL